MVAEKWAWLRKKNSQPLTLSLILVLKPNYHEPRNAMEASQSLRLTVITSTSGYSESLLISYTQLTRYFAPAVIQGSKTDIMMSNQRQIWSKLQ